MKQKLMVNLGASSGGGGGSSGGTKLYNHYIRFNEARKSSTFKYVDSALDMNISSGSGSIDLHVISTKDTKYTDMTGILNDIQSGAIIRAYNHALTPVAFTSKASSTSFHLYSLNVEDDKVILVEHIVNSFGYYRSDDILPL